VKSLRVKTLTRIANEVYDWLKGPEDEEFDRKANLEYVTLDLVGAFANL
jgi:hypothetical protein